MMESLRLFQNGGGAVGDIVSPNSSATMSANNLFHHSGSSPLKRLGQSRSFVEEESDNGGYDDHSLLPYTSTPFSSASIPQTHFDEDDLRNQLLQKEKDLILAAELGKALLEKNEELNNANEKMAEEFEKRLEHLEQEKHHLRNQMEAMEEEYEQKISDLQADLTQLRRRLQDAEIASRLSERERQSLVGQLTEQNQRLTAELKAAAAREEELQSRLNDLRSQVTDKRMSMQDHVNHLETLNDEIILVTRRKNELEKRIDELLGEREGLSSTLDETSDKIMMLERHAREQESQIRNNHREMSELRNHNQILTERLESLSRSLSSGCSSSVHMSLLCEMEMSTSGSDSDRSIYMPRRPCSQIEEEIEDIEEGGDDSEMTCVNNSEMKQLKEEILSAYQQMRTLCSQLRQREKKRRNSSDSLETSASSTSSEDSYNMHQVPVGLLNEIVLELKGLLHGLMRRDDRNTVCGRCQESTNSDQSHSDDERLNLEVESHRALENCDKLSLAIKQQEAELKRRDEEINELHSKLKILEIHLSASHEECDTLKQDLANTSISKEELVRKAWDVRDAAVKRKNAAEIELAKERIAGMQINSQLLEAIQQKVELSQQLEQWQVDMELLLGEQMKERLSSNDGRKRSSSSAMSISSDTDTNIIISPNAKGLNSGRTSRLLSFFQRTS